MHVAVVTPIATALVSLEDAKKHLRVDFDDDDALIEGLVAAATAYLDGPDGILNRALGTQVLLATLEGFPSEPVALRCEPIQSIDDITYIDADGAETPIDDTDVYELTDDGRLRLAHGQTWPTPRSSEDPVRINYTAGYTSLPKPLRAAILLIVGDLYANCESGGTGTVAYENQMPTTVRALLAPYRNLRA